MSEGTRAMGSGLTLRDYMRVLWRWKWVVVLAVCASTAAAYAYSARQTPQYKATAELMYVQPVDPTDPLTQGASDNGGPAVGDVANVMGSPPSSPAPLIVARAHKLLGISALSPDHISTTVEGSSTTGSTGVIDISATSTDPRRAAAVANAYAQAVIDWRRVEQLHRVKLAERAVKTELSTYRSAASRVTPDYLALRQNLQSLKLVEHTASGDFQLINQAPVPVVPSAPRPKRSAALGLGVGLLAGIGLAFLFNQLTTRVRGREELGEVLGLPVVGSLPDMPLPSKNKGRLVALGDPAGRAAEALRMLRSNLDYVNVEGVSTLLMTSAVADEGKTLTVCNLAATMAMAGKRVVVVDGDLRRPRVHEYFRLANDVGLTSVAARTAVLPDALQSVDLPPALPGSPGGNGPRPDSALQTKSHHGLVVLTAGPPISDPGELVASRRFGAIIRELHTATVDFIIVDSPALLEFGDAAAMAAQVEGMLVVVGLDRAKRTTLLQAHDLLASLPCRKLGVVLVRAKHGYPGYYD